MAKPSTEQVLAIYRSVLARYEAVADPKADVQRRLIVRLERKLVEERREK